MHQKPKRTQIQMLLVLRLVLAIALAIPLVRASHSFANGESDIQILKAGELMPPAETWGIVFSHEFGSPGFHRIPDVNNLRLFHYERLKTQAAVEGSWFPEWNIGVALPSAHPWIAHGEGPLWSELFESTYTGFALDRKWNVESIQHEFEGALKVFNSEWDHETNNEEPIRKAIDFPILINTYDTYFPKDAPALSTEKIDEYKKEQQSVQTQIESYFPRIRAAARTHIESLKLVAQTPLLRLYRFERIKHRKIVNLSLPETDQIATESFGLLFSLNPRTGTLRTFVFQTESAELYENYRDYNKHNEWQFRSKARGQYALRFSIETLLKVPTGFSEAGRSQRAVKGVNLENGNDTVEMSPSVSADGVQTLLIPSRIFVEPLFANALLEPLDENDIIGKNILGTPRDVCEVIARIYVKNEDLMPDLQTVLKTEKSEPAFLTDLSHVLQNIPVRPVCDAKSPLYKGGRK